MSTLKLSKNVKAMMGCLSTLVKILSIKKNFSKNIIFKCSSICPTANAENQYETKKQSKTQTQKSWQEFQLVYMPISSWLHIKTNPQLVSFQNLNFNIILWITSTFIN